MAPDTELKQASVRADKLAWPLGVVVSSDGAEVWVVESWAHRLAAHPRGGGKERIIARNYSGYPARLAGGDPGHVWMAFFGLRTQLTEFVLRERAFCEEMMQTVPPELWIGPAHGRFDYREPTQVGRIKKLGIQKPWASARSYGLVARLDSKGETIESLHSRVDGRIHGITSVRPIDSRILAVSKGRNCVVELPLARGAEEG
jgi:hypothetical protein